jgi:GMP synthase (glutamine-hydrolysing)
MRYREVNPELLAAYPFTAMLISGFGQSFDTMDLSAMYGLYDVLHTTTLPVLGLCGGHRIIAKAFTSDFRQVEKLEDEPIRELRPGEPDYSPNYHPGMFTESGMQPVRLVAPEDPLLAGLPETVFMLEAHYCEVRELPPGFTLLATNDNCRVQAMRHPERPIYGTQFHPEGYTDYYADGQQLLRNFFALSAAPAGV